MSVISVIVATDTLSHREALKSILSKVQNVFKVLDSVGLEEVAEKSIQLQPEVILCGVKDSEIPVSLLNDIKSSCPQTALILVTENEDSEMVVNALKTGVDACMGMTTPGYMARLVELVCRGNIMVFPRTIKPQIQKMVTVSERLVPKLLEEMTDREKEIFKLLLKKYSNKEIAKRLFISDSTVKTHVRSILQKIGAKNRAALKENYYVI